MSLDIPLAVQRQMLRDQWARDAAMRQPPSAASPPGLASRTETAMPAAADCGASLPESQPPKEAAVQVRRAPPPAARPEPEPEPQAAAEDAGPEVTEPAGLTPGQRHVLARLAGRRLPVPAVLRSHHTEILALTVGEVLDAAGCPGAAAAAGIDPATALGELSEARQDRLTDVLPAWCTRVRP